jgi:hypothetical protein
MPKTRLKKEKDALSCGFSATRAPHRFNPIGQSLVKIESVDAENGVIYISGHDLLNNTLILDIKPLHLSDLPLYQTICFPAWVHNSYTKQFNQLLRNQGVIGSPYGFATEQMVMNQQTANLMKLLSMRTTALAPTNNTVKPWFLALLPFSTKTQPVNSNNSNNSNSSNKSSLHCCKKRFQQNSSNPSFPNPPPFVFSQFSTPNRLPNHPQTMTDDAPLTKSPVDTVLSPDGFPALALCNEAACVQFDPLALLYLQYCFWCQYNLFYAKEPLTATTSAIVAQIDAQYQAVIDFDAQMNKWRAEMADFEGLAMVPANIPAEEPFQPHPSPPHHFSLRHHG